MGYPLDEAAQNAVLDSLLGDNAGATMPTSFEVALFNGHPLLGGTELTGDGGYVRPVIANDSATWPDALSGQKLSVDIALATPTGAFSDTATDALLIDAADSTTAYFPVRLLEELSIDAAGEDASIQLAAFWNTSGL